MGNDVYMFMQLNHVFYTMYGMTSSVTLENSHHALTRITKAVRNQPTTGRC